jgi:site-specific DNA-methyltransferase (adenine-specific)
VSAEKVDHPCVIPLEVMRNIVAITPAKRIIDPFAGSGSTLVAAKQLNRSAIGIELDKSYCAMARKRLSSASRPPIPDHCVNSISVKI